MRSDETKRMVAMLKYDSPGPVVVDSAKDVGDTVLCFCGAFFGALVGRYVGAVVGTAVGGYVGWAVVEKQLLANNPRYENPVRKKVDEIIEASYEVVK